MTVGKQLLALAAAATISVPALAETVEENMIANCDWQESRSIAQHSVQTETERPDARSEEDRLANCDYLDLPTLVAHRI